jgi:hypothetical protein
MKSARVLLAVICTALFCSESFGQVVTNIIFAQGLSATNHMDGPPGDLVDQKLDYAQRLHDLNYLSAASEETIDAVRVLNSRVKAIAEAQGITFGAKDEYAELPRQRRRDSGSGVLCTALLGLAKALILPGFRASKKK